MSDFSGGAFDQQGLRASPCTDDRVGHADLRKGFRQVVLGVIEGMAKVFEGFPAEADTISPVPQVGLTTRCRPHELKQTVVA